MSYRSSSKDHAQAEQKETTVGRSPSATHVVNDRLIKAVRRALQATSSQRGSPAWAVHNIFFETAFHGESDREWVQRFLAMEPEDYLIKWDVSVDAWSGNGTIDFSGYEIAQQCARWIENGWDFNTYDADEDPCAHEAEDVPYTWNEGETLLDQEDSGEEFFPLPLEGEIVRRVWAHKRDGKTVLQYLDIRRADHCELYEYAVQEEGNPALVAHSGGLLERSMLELLVKAEALPVSASAPYFVEARRWLDQARKAGMKKPKPVHGLGFCAAS